MLSRTTGFSFSDKLPKTNRVGDGGGGGGKRQSGADPVRAVGAGLLEAGVSAGDGGIEGSGMLLITGTLGARASSFLPIGGV